MISLAAYTPAVVNDPGLAVLEPYLDALRQIYGNILSNPAARPSFWGEPQVAGTGEYELHLCDNGMLVRQWTVDWGDGSTPQQVSDGPWVIHAYPGNTSQYPDYRHRHESRRHVHRRPGPHAGRIGPEFQCRRSGRTTNGASHGRNPDWATQAGGEGQQTTNFEDGGGFDQAGAVALDNGNILVAGTTGDGQFGLVRYTDDPGQTDDGELDTTFGDRRAGDDDLCRGQCHGRRAWPWTPTTPRSWWPAGR